MTNNPDNLATQYTATQTMPAVGITDLPGVGKVADHLKMLEIAVPRPMKDQVAIKLAASSMHIDEIYAAQGTALGRFYGPKYVSQANPHLIGSSVSGTVVGLGSDVTSFKIGDQIIAIPNHQMETGSWATYRCIDHKMVMHKPDDLAHVEAAAATMAACVAWGAIGFAKVEAGDHCAVVGATGAIGVMIVQYLKSIDCPVTAICSGENTAFAKQYGANDVVDYTKDDFGDVAIAKGAQYDAVFDCVGGRDIEASAFRSLKKSGVFETVVGPLRYIGENKLSWPAFAKVMGHIIWRMVATRIGGGPHYTFGEKLPRFVIKEAMDQLLKHEIRMPVAATVPFEIDAVRKAVTSLTTHRTKGRTVIDFTLDQIK